MITHLKIGIMGTVEFDGKFLGMRKPQSFLVYPMHGDNAPETSIKIQSNKLLGRVCLDTGVMMLSGKQPGETIPEEERQQLRDWVRKSGSKDLVGSSFVKTDNSGALHLWEV